MQGEDMQAEENEGAHDIDQAGFANVGAEMTKSHSIDREA